MSNVSRSALLHVVKLDLETLDKGVDITCLSLNM